MFGQPHVWMPSICLDAYIFGHPPCLMTLYVTPPCLDAPYTHNTKKACFARLRGCPYAHIHLDAPMFGNSQTYEGIKIYWGAYEQPLSL